MDAVRPRIPALAPGAQKIALTVEHHDRVLAAVEDVYIVFGINPHGPDLLERPSVRRLRPILDDAVFEIPAANDNCHARPPVFCRGESIEATGAKQAHQERDAEELPRLLVIASLAQGIRFKRACPPLSYR